jgi:PAS domain S-box-containing protein
MNPNDLVHKKLQRELALYKAMINAALDSITIIDRNYVYRIVTDAFANARRCKKEDVINRSVAEVWGQEAFEQVIKGKLDECFAGKTVSYVAAYEFEKGKTDYIETIYTPCFGSGSSTNFAVVVSHNITELKLRQQRIRKLAFYDPLTGLASKSLFLDLLNREIKKANRTDSSLAVFFIDLNEFKTINDTLGHQTGDHLLAGVGKRLVKCLRQSDIICRPAQDPDDDRSQDYLARFGGDEFAFVIPDVAGKKGVSGLAQRVLNVLKEPYGLRDREISISCSMGIAFYPEDGSDVETLLNHTEKAMYTAREAGKNTYEFFSFST